MNGEKHSLAYRQARVKEVWDQIEHNEPDISTERLLWMVGNETAEHQRDIMELYRGAAPTEG